MMHHFLFADGKCLLFVGHLFIKTTGFNIVAMSFPQFPCYYFWSIGLK